MIDFLSDIVKWLIILAGVIVLIANIFKYFARAFNFIGNIIKGKDIFERIAPVLKRISLVLFKIANGIKSIIKIFTNGGKKR